MKALEYFSHDVDASTNPKFEHLRRQYGWAGEGQFWALVGLMGQNEEGELDLKRPFLRASLAERFEMTDETFMDFIAYLATQCELIHYEDGVIWTDRIKDDLDRVKAGREKVKRYRAKKATTSAPATDAKPAPESAPAPAAAPKKETEEKPSEAPADAPVARQSAPAAVPAAAPKARAKREPKTRELALVKPEKDDMYDWLFNGFLEANGGVFANYGIEGRAVKTLCKQARAFCPDDPQAFLRQFMATFKQLQRKESFFANQPFLPSSLSANGIFTRIIEGMKKAEATQDTSWVEHKLQEAIV
jgi:hypothetical protein